MNLLAETLGLTSLIGGWLVMALTVVWAIKTAPWYKIDSDRGAQHVWLAMIVILFFVWQFGAHLDNGINFHFLLMSLAALMFGPQFAILGMVLAVIGVTFYSGLGWHAIGINALLLGVVPVAITWFMYRLGAKFLEANFFVYIFYNGFLAAAMGSAISLVLTGWVLMLNQVYTPATMEESFWLYIPLLSAPEGFLNGMLVTVLILLKPHWVATFHDDIYLKGK